MVVTTLKVFGTGQVTLPKEWRDKYKTDLFLAREVKNGLFIKPITYDDSDFEMIEYDDGESFGWHFPKGIPANILEHKLRQAYAALHKDTQKIPAASSAKTHRGHSKNTAKRSRKS